MAQQIIQDLSEDFLHCSICMERFKKPLMLPCLHSFCYCCLKKCESKLQGGQFSCPVCRRSVELTDDGVEGLPNNFFLTSLMERLDLVEKLTKETTANCDFCRRDLGVLFCLDCKLHICSTCKDVHTRIPGTGDHVITSSEKLMDAAYLKQITSKKSPHCEEHKEEKLRFYCKTCSHLVCRDCTIVDHQGHQCVKAESEAVSAKERLEALLKDNDEESEGALKLTETLEKSVNSLETQATKMLELVDYQYDKCVEKLKCDREALRKKIENVKNKKCGSLEKTRGELSNALQAMGNIKEVTRRVLEENNVWEIVRMEQDIVESFEKIENNLESICEDSQGEDSSSEEFDSDDSSSDDSDDSDVREDSEDSDRNDKSIGSEVSDSSGDGNDYQDKKNDSGSDASESNGDDVEKKINNANNCEDDDDDESIDDEDANIGIKFIPSKIEPSDISLLGTAVRSKSNWRNKNHVGKIVRS